jgi:hypothetical protein
MRRLLVRDCISQLAGVARRDLSKSPTYGLRHMHACMTIYIIPWSCVGWRKPDLNRHLVRALRSSAKGNNERRAFLPGPAARPHYTVNACVSINDIP